MLVRPGPGPEGRLRPGRSKLHSRLLEEVLVQTSKECTLYGRRRAGEQVKHKVGSEVPENESFIPPVK